jgi:hypothetical protein
MFDHLANTPVVSGIRQSSPVWVSRICAIPCTRRRPPPEDSRTRASMERVGVGRDAADSGPRRYSGPHLSSGDIRPGQHTVKEPTESDGTCRHSVAGRTTSDLRKCWSESGSILP